MSRRALEAGAALLREGRVVAACVALEALVGAHPDDADAWHLLAVARGRRDGPGAAIALGERAISIDPEHGPAWHNLGRALRATGALDRAETALLRAGELLDDRVDPWVELAQVGVARMERGDLAGAARALGLAAQGIPSEPGIAILLGRARRDLGDLDGALRAVEGVHHPAADALRGSVAERQGESERAAHAFERAVRAAPDDGASWHNLARLLRRMGELDRALAAHERALSLAPDDRDRWIGWVDTVAAHPEPPASLESRLAAALAIEGIGHQGLERAIRRCVDGAVSSLSWPDAPGADGWAAVVAALDRPLVHGWLRRTRVLGPVWERRLAALRGADLHGQILRDRPELRVSLAVQALHTGHAWGYAPSDLALAAALSQDDPAALAQRAAWPVPLAAGAPGWAEAPMLAPLHRVAVAQPQVERDLADRVAELGGGATPAIQAVAARTSRAVREQYEEHPYPRLISVHLKPPAPLPAVLAEILPRVRELPDPRPLRLLIAGCGTGQQILAAATRYADVQIVALDLSRASLGVAARQLAERGLSDRVRLLRGDLLALSPEIGTFDLVECGGVLHHLAEPLAGLRALVGVLAPGGLLKLGVYSELARADVVAAQALLRARSVGTTPDELRRGRQILLDLPADHPAAPVRWSPDFPSLAGFRDLVLHACEHRYTLDRLGAELAAVELELLGFQHPDPRPAALYASAFPDDPEQRDLGRWSAIEREHPECFRGMYQVWCRRRQASMS